MIVYKGTDKDMKCRGFQFDLGKEYVEEEAKLCEKGFHGCEYPLDVFGHYAPADSRFFVADLDGVTDEMQSDDTKRVGTKVTLRAEIGIPGIVKAAVEYIKERTGKTEDATGYQSAATNTGDQSAATNTGDQSAATNTGNWSAATNTGDRSAATNTGNWSAATNTGNWSAATNTGDRSAATNTGNWSAATNTGNWSAATNTGDRSAATNTGDRSAATNTGDWSAATNTGNWSAATNTGDRSAATNTGDQSAAAITFTMAFAASGTVRTGVFQHVINVIRKYSDLLANPSVMVEQPRYRYDELNVLEIPNEQVQEAFDVWVSFRDSARFRKTSSLTITSLIQMLHYLRSINHQISNCSHLP